MNPFDYNNSPTPEMVGKMNEVRAKSKELAEIILTIDNSAERTLAMRSLEIAAMWANKAVTHQPKEQVQ